MKRYPQQARISVFAAAGAVLATAAVIGMGVILPATLAPSTDTTLMASTERAPIEVAINPSRIEVIGYRTERPVVTPVVTSSQQARDSADSPKS